MNDLPHGLLRQKREQMGLSLDTVVKELENRGISISIKTLYGYENGVSTPRVNTFIALCDIYKVSDIMGEFGYATSLKLASGDAEWSYDEYNDFFKGTLLEKIYLLLNKGVPSFAGYESQLENCFPSSDKAASFNRLYNLFSALDESAQATVFHTINDLNGNPYGCIEDIDFITLFHRASKSDQDIILAVLDKYRDKFLEESFNYHINGSAKTVVAPASDRASHDIEAELSAYRAELLSQIESQQVGLAGSTASAGSSAGKLA